MNAAFNSEIVCWAKTYFGNVQLINYADLKFPILTASCDVLREFSLPDVPLSNIPIAS